MQKIVIQKGSKGEEILKKMLLSKEEAKKRMEKRMIPIEMMKIINKKTDEVFELNKGNLDKDSFRLGMMSMWYHLNLKPKDNDEGNKQEKSNS